MSHDAYNPALYALVHRGTPGDVRFYAEACRGAKRVLELGCGYGRLISSLAGNGTQYHGLDLDPDLLRLAKRRRRELPAACRARVHLHRGDMRDFCFRERFNRIVIPYSALYCLRSERDVSRCFRCVREHLADAGELLLDAYYADDLHQTLDPEFMRRSPRDFLTQVEEAGVSYQVFEQTRWQRRAQRLVVTYDYETPGGEVFRGRITHRYLLRTQLESLLGRAGLEVTQVAGSFAGGRLTKRSEQIVVRARRRG